MRLQHNGYEINYDVAGDGPPLVLIHGVGSSLESWDSIVERLRNTYRVLRYDTLGHGDSEKPDGPYALDDYVSELLAVLDAEIIARTHIVGSSFGGMIAQAFAIADPERSPGRAPQCRRGSDSRAARGGDRARGPGDGWGGRRSARPWSVGTRQSSAPRT